MLDDPRPVFLVGFMGAGKTVAGRALAELVGWEFVDTDDRVVEREGRSIEEIFAGPGEGRFRALEWDALRALEDTRRAVVATGGGAFLGRVQRRFMKLTGRTVWLDVSLEVAMARLGDGAGRPLWLPGDPVDLRALFDRRVAVYALAERRVDASEGSPGDVARRVLERLGGGSVS